MTDELGDRAQEVLRALVREYIDTGAPVGSSQLARRADFDVSPATLRSVMADLEALGYLEKPHTSAGRIPTDRGYRFFVDTQLRLREPAPRDRELIEQGIPTQPNVEGALQEAGRVLHFLTRHAGIVLVPSPAAGTLKRIDFVRLREDRVLAILVGQDGGVRNKVLGVGFPVTGEELVRAANYLNALLAELTFDEARLRIQEELSREQALLDAQVGKALRLGYAATDLSTPERVLIEGAGSFLETPEFADVERMRALFKALEEKQKLLSLLDQVQRARQMQIFIGNESAFSSAGDVSVVATPYGTAERTVGTVGVIGPTRMNYSRIIPLVRLTAQVLGRVLENGP
jgi:heat-inducible transcriptional repressor